MAQTRVPLHVDATLGRNSNPSPSSMDSLDQTSTATSVSGDNNSLLLHHQQQHLLKDHQRPEGDDDDDDDDENEQYVIVRALYPFESKDPTSLSFEKDALIQVLTQLESGWWYGFCNDERGWFPSNYVQEISEDELEQELELAMHRSHPDDTDDARSNDVQSDPEEDEDMASVYLLFFVNAVHDTLTLTPLFIFDIICSFFFFVGACVVWNGVYSKYILTY